MISLRSKITQKILNLLFLNEKEKFYVNELAKLIKEDPSNVYKKLLELREEGILSDDFQGKERYFSLNCFILFSFISWLSGIKNPSFL